MTRRKGGLGRGLDALIPQGAVEQQEGQSRPSSTTASGPAPHSALPGLLQVPVDSIGPNPRQPRQSMPPDLLDELAASIREHGILQPLVVTRTEEGKYSLIAGERRWRASQQLGLTEAPVIVREANDLEVLELSLIENLQRADLNPIEEAEAYARLAGEFEMRQEDIARKVGRSRAAVANSMRLLDLEPQVQGWVTQGLLSVGHAKVLLGLKAHDEQLAIAETILRRSSPVRDAERMVARQLGGTRRRRRSASAEVSSATLDALQNRLQTHLGTRVVLHHGEKRGRIEIDYYGNDDLERVLSALGLPKSDD